MRRAKAIAATLGSMWIGFVILACSDTDAEVEGDLTTSGRCPEGESCAPRTSGPRYFLAAKPPGAEPSVGELPPVATGARTWVRFVEPSDAWFGEPVRDVFGVRIEVEGEARVERYGALTTIAAPSSGAFVVRAVDRAGNLHERTRVRVVDPVEVVARPAVGGPIGPARGWRVWPGAVVPLLKEARSATGEQLVSLTEEEARPELGPTFTVEAPSSGPLEVELHAGYLTATTSFPPATEIESVVGYVPDDCESLRDYLICFFGVQEGNPIVGAPLSTTFVDEDGEPSVYELAPAFPCFFRDEEPGAVELSAGAELWTRPVPAAGTSCSEE